MIMKLDAVYFPCNKSNKISVILIIFANNFVKESKENRINN